VNVPQGWSNRCINFQFKRSGLCCASLGGRPHNTSTLSRHIFPVILQFEFQSQECSPRRNSRSMLTKADDSFRHVSIHPCSPEEDSSSGMSHSPLLSTSPHHTQQITSSYETNHCWLLAMSVTVVVPPTVWVRGCRIGPLRFLAGWRKRRLNQAFSFVLVQLDCVYGSTSLLLVSITFVCMCVCR